MGEACRRWRAVLRWGLLQVGLEGVPGGARPANLEVGGGLQVVTWLDPIQS